jgi:hypothetical protein
VAVAPLEGLEDGLGTVAAERLDVDGLGLEQIRLHVVPVSFNTLGSLHR